MSSSLRHLCDSCGLAAILAFLLTSCPGPKPPNLETPSPSPPAVAPTPTALPEGFIPSSRMETARLFNGMEIHSRVTTAEGAPAVTERKTPDAYLLDLEVKVKVPQACPDLGGTHRCGPADRLGFARAEKRPSCCDSIKLLPRPLPVKGGRCESDTSSPRPNRFAP